MNRVVIVFLVVFNIVLFTYYAVHLVHIFLEIYHHPSHQSSEEFDTIDEHDNRFRKLDKYQPIPAGMHVRVNLQTGEREGRWLTKEDYQRDKDTSLVAIPDNDKQKKHDLGKLKYQHLENAIKNIPNEISTDDNKEQIKRKFRSYEQLKKEMSELNFKVQTDAEVLDQLMNKFHEIKAKNLLNLEDQEELVNVLKNLEYLLHQVDNAKEFVKQNGMISVILPTLMSNSTTLRTMSAKVLGAAVQNNGNVQIAALKAGVIPHLLRNIALEKDLELRASSIYAISCLVRSFPLAEIKLIDEGGLSILMKVFDETSDDSLKLQLKVVTFFGDLIIEKEDAKFTMEEKEKLIQNVTDELPQEEFQQIAEKFRQYSMVELNSKLVELSWCAKLSHLLVTRSFKKDIFNSNNNILSMMNEDDGNHEVVDDVITATLPIINQCQEQFLNEPKVNNVLPTVLKYYEKLAREENDDTFYHDLYDKLNKLCTILKLK